MASELVDLNSSINIQEQQRKLPKGFFKHRVKGKHGDDTRKKDEEQPSQIKELYEHQNGIEQDTRKNSLELQVYMAFPKTYTLPQKMLLYFARRC